MDFLSLALAIALGIFVGKVAEDFLIAGIKTYAYKRKRRQQSVAYEELSKRLSAIMQEENEAQAQANAARGGESTDG